jgi:GNAT superfamily N-acetyltransferase
MMQTEDLEIRKLDLSGLHTLLQWAQNEGWNPGPFDAAAFWATDPDAFYGYYDRQILIAGGALVSYNGAFGFMGLFIVHPEYRNMGIGRKLWYQRRNRLLERLNPGASIGMDGVLAMQPFYQKGGFEIAWNNERYENTGTRFPVNENIRRMTEADFDALSHYDKQCFGFSREPFLRQWITMPESKGFVYSENHHLKGFCVLRKVHKGYKIGPLFGDDHRIAEELYKVCLNAVAGEPVYIDIPMINSGAVEMMKKYGATYVFECARMYYGPIPKTDLNKVFGITSFELG